MAAFSIRGRYIDCVLSGDGPSDPRDRLAALAIANHANSEGRSAWPSERQLVTATGYARNTVRAAINNLISTGWIEKRPLKRGQYGKLISEYLLTFPSQGNGAAAEPVIDCSNGATSEPVPRLANVGQWPTVGSGNGSANGLGNGSSVGSATEPESIIQSSKSKTQEPMTTASEEAVLEMTIDQLELGEEAIEICQLARPGADPNVLLRKFKSWGAGKPSKEWQRSLKKFAVMERLSDDEMRAEQRARYNGAGPRRPRESSTEYARRAADPEFDLELDEVLNTGDDIPF